MKHIHTSLLSTFKESQRVARLILNKYSTFRAGSQNNSLVNRMLVQFQNAVLSVRLMILGLRATKVRIDTNGGLNTKLRVLVAIIQKASFHVIITELLLHLRRDWVFRLDHSGLL